MPEPFSCRTLTPMRLALLATPTVEPPMVPAQWVPGVGLVLEDGGEFVRLRHTVAVVVGVGGVVSVAHGSTAAKLGVGGQDARVDDIDVGAAAEIGVAVSVGVAEKVSAYDV